jgi:hypothetical protein
LYLVFFWFGWRDGRRLFWWIFLTLIFKLVYNNIPREHKTVNTLWTVS